MYRLRLGIPSFGCTTGNDLSLAVEGDFEISGELETIIFLYIAVFSRRWHLSCPIYRSAFCRDQHPTTTCCTEGGCPETAWCNIQGGGVVNSSEWVRLQGLLDPPGTPPLDARGGLPHLNWSGDEKLASEVSVHGRQQEMWTLSEDARSVQLNMPPVNVSKPGPVSIRVDFDAQAIDAMLERLTRLRVQMMPPPRRN
jgi:hypothetical protein